MVREIVRDILFLRGKSSDAAKEDLAIGKDLEDTLTANRERCVGLAANMVGERKKIIVFDNEGKSETMFNPEIVMAKGPYMTKEGCLSLDGVRKTKRYKLIKVKWLDSEFNEKIKNFEGFTAQIIQHEIDHTNGIII